MSDQFGITTDNGTKFVHENHAVRMVAQEFRRMGSRYQVVTIDSPTLLNVASAMDALVNRAENSALLLGMALGRLQEQAKRRRVDWGGVSTAVGILAWSMGLAAMGAVAATVLRH